MYTRREELNLDLMDLPQDCPTEWWYFNMHLDNVTKDDERYRPLSLFACFFNQKDSMGEEYPFYVFAVSSGYSEDPNEQTPPIVRTRYSPNLKKFSQRVLQYMRLEDQHLLDSMRRVLDKGEMPLPDQYGMSEPIYNSNPFSIEMDELKLGKTEDGHYWVKFDGKEVSCDLQIVPRKTALIHGVDGTVPVAPQESMFYYSLPRNSVEGSVRLRGDSLSASGICWYDHEFGGVALPVPSHELQGGYAVRHATNGHSNGIANGHANGHSNGHANGHANGHVNGHANGHANGHTNGVSQPKEKSAYSDSVAKVKNHKTKEQMQRDNSWLWTSAHLDNGYDITVSQIMQSSGTEVMYANIINPDGETAYFGHDDIEIEILDTYTSLKTFRTYPISVRIQVPGTFDITCKGMPAQEIVTMAGRVAFYETVLKVEGTLHGEDVEGHGFLEDAHRTQFTNIKQILGEVSRIVLARIEEMVPKQPTLENIGYLLQDPHRGTGFADHVGIEEFKKSIVEPLRSITDRRGKAWRSYVFSSCAFAVADTNSPLYNDIEYNVRVLIAFPELLHVGSLIVDDVQDQSVTRRGGPACHCVYGEPVAINAGCASYFHGTVLVDELKLTDSQKIEFIKLYFAALRVGHAGQGLDIVGLAHLIPSCIDNGTLQSLEEKLICIYQLKSGVPASVAARIGVLLGHGSLEQQNKLGLYFEEVGISFQIMDDVLDLGGFEDNLKDRAMDLRAGKCTLPVLKALQKLSKEEAHEMWNDILTCAEDDEKHARILHQLEDLNVLQECTDQATKRIERAW
eukprot:CAMPEP_0174260718 /NCGR_PEP_ID=MMETSP0439-20130205/10345_1 /TAXON_ID=0 /ORGANISM="Stereomyxa ramosa, Strain Chinc5" /LENGTH=794 /DNA_ID=CAMNT_0015345025 /DNA_START=45 /DNA_END=2426 /DNA_ORIENTATION=+